MHEAMKLTVTELAAVKLRRELLQEGPGRARAGSILPQRRSLRRRALTHICD
jgi:hypothetical protein